MPADNPDIHALFNEAAARTSPEERSQYLDEACGSDPKIRERVEALLRAHSEAGGFFGGQSPASPITDTGPVTERPGTVIGPYKLLQQLGEGGMGTVFMAEQSEPVQRKVALKVIKPGMDSRQVIARFEVERQALALMEHPNIAKVLDAGTTASGRPYFVMELVKGISITKYCDQEHLAPKDRLELFIPVCQAVQHAHQKGIIHRDLKPANVLIALYDGKPVPKVIDFGVAKATAQKLTERTMYTAVGQIIGTLEYMAPEQAELNNLDIDTRADIYSLGALLYELLAGSPPFTAEQLRGAALAEMLRTIREDDPPKPSARVSSSDALASIAAVRRLEPKHLTRLLRGDLDWIAMKCLEKERGRRYETANGLTRDLQRYLADEVVEARPPSAGYRLRKFARRHKAQVIAASLVLLVLLAGIAGTSFGLFRAEQQQQLAEAREKLAGDRLIQVEAEKRNVEDEKKKVEEEKKVSQAVRRFLRDKLLGQTDTRAQADALLDAGESSAKAKLNPTIRDLLDRAALELAPDKIEANFPKQPLVQAELLSTIGDTYRAVGEHDLAIPFLTRAAELSTTSLGADHAGTRFALDALAEAYLDARRLPEAIALIEKERDARVQKLGAEHRATLSSINNLAQAYLDAGRLPKAIALLEQMRDVQVKTLGADHRDTLTNLNNLAVAYGKAGKLPQAIELLEQVRDVQVKKLGADHPETLTTLHNLAVGYRRSGKVPQAIELLQQVRDVQVKKLGADHRSTRKTLDDLAIAYRDAGKLPQAIEVLEQVRDLWVKRLGVDHPETLTALNNLVSAYQEAGRLPQALPLFEQAATGFDKRNYQHQYAGLVISNTIGAYEAAQQYDKAEKWRRKWLAVVKQQAGARSPAYGGDLALLGINLLHQKKYLEAEAALRECLELRKKLLEKRQAAPWQVACATSMLGESLLGQTKPAEAEPLLVAGYEGLRQDEKAIPDVARQARMTEAIQRLIDLAAATNKPNDMKKWQAEQAKYRTEKRAEKKAGGKQ